MNWIKGSFIVQAVLSIGGWVRGSKIISSIIKSGRESKVIRRIYHYEPKRNKCLLGCSMFCEKGKNHNEILGQKTKSLLTYRPFKWFRDSFFVSEIITFLECEKDDRMA